MLSPAAFLKLYQLLDVDMVEADCGDPCSRLCCNGPPRLFKFLLPGEDEFLARRGFFQHARLEDLGYVLHYYDPQGAPCVCAPMRSSRPFTCRMFPFRPTFDPAYTAVAGIRKVEAARFAACWIGPPRAEWRANAVAAWQLVLADEETRAFFARLSVCREVAEHSGGLSFADLLSTDGAFRRRLREVPRLPPHEQLRLLERLYASDT